MRDRPVSRFMTAPPLSAAPEATVAEARALCASRGVRHLPLVSGGRLVGIVSLADLKGAADDTPLRALGSRDPDTLRPDDSLQEAARRLGSSEHHALPVVDAAGQLVGLVTSTDLIVLLLTQVNSGDGMHAPDELATVLATAERRCARGDDPDSLAASLLWLAGRQQRLEDVVRKAEEYLHSGHGAREHAALVRAIERARAGVLPGGRL